MLELIKKTETNRLPNYSGRGDIRARVDHELIKRAKPSAFNRE